MTPLTFTSRLLPDASVAVNRPPSSGESKGTWREYECEDTEEVADLLQRYSDRAETYVALATFAAGAGRKNAAIVAKDWISIDIDDNAMPGSPEEAHRRLVAEAEYSWTLGLMAYAIVEDQKYEWIAHLRNVEDREPTTAEIEIWFRN